MKKLSSLCGCVYGGIAAVLMLFFSCQSSLYYSDYHNFSHAQWDRRDALTFSLPPSDQDLDTRLTVGLRALPSFRYQDVVMRLELLADDTLSVASVPVSITLYEGDTPQGQGVAIIDHFSAPQSFTLQAHRHYTVRLTHLMRLNPLDDIPAVGILVER